MVMVADPQECRDFLAANPQVRFVEVFFTSMTGVPRGKRLRVHELEAIYNYGRFLPGSILAGALLLSVTSIVSPGSRKPARQEYMPGWKCGERPSRQRSRSISMTSMMATGSVRGKIVWLHASQTRR